MKEEIYRETNKTPEFSLILTFLLNTKLFLFFLIHGTIFMYYFFNLCSSCFSVLHFLYFPVFPSYILFTYLLRDLGEKPEKTIIYYCVRLLVRLLSVFTSLYIVYFEIGNNRDVK